MRIQTLQVMVAVMAIVALLVPACGVTEQGGGGTVTTVEETTVTEEPSTTTEAEVEGEDAAARAEAALLTRDDFPANFEPVPDEPGADDTDDEDDDEGSGHGELTEDCGSDVAPPGGTVAKARSDDFEARDSQVEATTFFSLSRVVSSEEVAAEAVDLLGDDAFAACLSAELRESWAPAEVTGDLRRHDFDAGDHAAALRGAFTLTYPDDRGTHVVDVAFIVIRTGDLVTLLFGIAVGRGLDADLVAHLADVIADRQEA